MTRFVSWRLPLAAAVPLLLAAGGIALAQPKEAPAPARGAQKPAGKADEKAGAASSKDAKKGAPKDAKGKGAAGPGGPQANLLATFGDWTAYVSQQGRAKLCYALAKPKDLQPKDKRSPAYVFVSFRPADNVRNEIAIVMGLPTKDGGAAEAQVGKTTYALITKDQNAWVKDSGEESRVVATMSKGQTLVVKAAAKTGAKVTDSYSLNGFGPALERARKECS